MQHAHKQCKTPGELLKISWKTPGIFVPRTCRNPDVYNYTYMYVCIDWNDYGRDEIVQGGICPTQNQGEVVRGKCLFPFCPISWNMLCICLRTSATMPNFYFHDDFFINTTSYTVKNFHHREGRIGLGLGLVWSLKTSLKNSPATEVHFFASWGEYSVTE